MDFALSEEQEALGTAARDLLDHHASPERRRAHLEFGASYDDGLWQAMAEQGWMAISLPEEHGGVGLGWVEAVVLLAEAGRHLAAVPFLPHLLALATIADGDPVGHGWIPELAGGGSIGCVAWPGRDDAFTVSGSGPEVVLTGRSGPVDAASVADVAVVVAGGDVHLVDLRSTGRPTAQPAMDETRRVAWLELDEAPAVRIGSEELARTVLDRGALASSAEMLGGAEAVLEMSVAHARDRVQFGRPIGSFQAVKHRCADMLVDVEGMRSTVWHAAACLDGVAGDDPSTACSAAKIWCNDASERVMTSGLQVHGGIGFTWEHELHRYVKRAQFDRQSWGSADDHRSRLASLLRRRIATGTGLL